MTASVEKNHVVDVEKIKSLCEIRGIPLAEFGRRIGLDSREGISRRLQNKHKITGDELVLMARELGVSVEDLAVA
jgi:transcriptional regulator with XRE-family HTH domain